VRGVNVIVLLALTDTGRPSYDPALSARVAALGIPVFACTPDQFPDLMATALKREDIAGWAARPGHQTDPGRNVAAPHNASRTSPHASPCNLRWYLYIPRLRQFDHTHDMSVLV
jgi:hypothetical protein